MQKSSSIWLMLSKRRQDLGTVNSSICSVNIYKEFCCESGTVHITRELGTLLPKDWYFKQGIKEWEFDQWIKKQHAPRYGGLGEDENLSEVIGG